MMMVLLDEPTLILFDSPDKPPDWLEEVDVMNGEYSFCDDDGQRYEGVITRPAGWLRDSVYGLRPVGTPDISNAMELIERAVMIEPNAWFADLESLRRHEPDRTTLAVDNLVTVSATVTDRRAESAPMAILDLPVPAGFALQADDLSALVASGAIARFQVTPRSAVVYLRGLSPNEPLALKYRLRAVMPVKLAVPPARAYEYYDPARNGSSAGARLTVEARK